MDIEEKYNKLRWKIKDGDLILFHGTGFVANVIQKSDNAYWNHIGVIIEKCGALYIVDANGNGVQADRLSWRIRKYRNGGNFMVIRPLASEDDIQDSLKELLKRSDEKWIRYDFKNGIKELLNRAFGFKFKIYKDDDKDICSDFVSQYAVSLNAVTQKFKDLTIQFPEDYERYRNFNNTRIIINKDL